MKQTMWGIDLGGTKIEGIILKSDKDPETRSGPGWILKLPKDMTM